MSTVQSSIRDKISQGEFPAPKGVEAFSAYLIARSKGLIPEMESAARQTLDHPMTFKIFGEGLRLSDGWALRDLANFRKRYRENLVSCFKSFLNIKESQLNIWRSCPDYSYISFDYSGSIFWLAELYEKHLNESREALSKSLFDSRNIRGEYLSALHNHVDMENCASCTKVHTKKGETFCKGLEDSLTRALNEVCPYSVFWSCWGLKIHPGALISVLRSVNDLFPFVEISGI